MNRYFGPIITVVLLFGSISVRGSADISHSTAALSAARFDLASAAVNGSVYFGGGDASAANASRVDIYTPSTNTWSVSTLSIGREQLAGTAANGLVYFAGGNNEVQAQTHFSRIDIYNPASNTWTTKELSVARSGLAAAAIGSKVVFAGGWTSNGIDSSRVDILDTTTGIFSSSDHAPLGSDTAVARVGQKLIFQGNTHDVMPVYDASTDSWATLTLPQGRGNPAITTIGDKVLFAGGELAGSDFDEVDIWDSTTNTWSLSHLSQARTFISAATAGDYAFFGGGASKDQVHGGYIPSAVVDVYQLSTDTWSTMQLASSRQRLTAVAMDNSVYFAGGLGPNGANSAAVDVFTVLPEPNTLAFLVPAALLLLRRGQR